MVPHILSIRIDPACLPFLDQTKYKKHLSERQKNFIASVRGIYNKLTLLSKQSLIQFTPKNQAEISRGALYALTRSLQEKFLRTEKINLADLKTCLNKEFNIADERVIDFIIMCLIEPVSIPLSLGILTSLMLAENYYCSNESSKPDPMFKYALKAEPTINDSNIVFNMVLTIKKIVLEETVPIGSADIQFTINPEKQVNLDPINMVLDFSDEKEFEQFQLALGNDFKDWLLDQDELDKITLASWPSNDTWLTAILIGLLLGLVAMIALIALNLTPIMPFLPLPAGLMLGLLSASFINLGCYISAKKEQEKIKRPIRLLKGAKPPTQSKLVENYATTSFFENRHQLDFNHPSLEKTSLALKPSS